ncbi:MAG: hypothetical protein KJZ65_15415 [Phycisphaerales bacterium]|nr:hypothetical protein [Phycisphaerales bacterium]
MACVVVLTGMTGQGFADYVGVSWAGGRIFRIDEFTLSATLVQEIGANGANAMARDDLGQMWIASASELWRFDPDTSGLVRAATLEVADVRGLAFAPDGRLFASVHEGAGPHRLYAIDVTSGQAALIGTNTHAGVQGLVLASDGSLYGWAVDAGLLRMDMASGATIDVNGVLSEPDNFLQTLFVGPGGALLGAGRHGGVGTEIVRVDPATGLWTTLGTVSMPPGLPTSAADLRGMERIPAPTGAAALALGAGLMGVRPRRGPFVGIAGTR